MGMTGMGGSATGMYNNPGLRRAIGLTGTTLTIHGQTGGNPGVTGISFPPGPTGVTGMGSPPKCFLCHNFYCDTYVNIDFSTTKDFSLAGSGKLYGLCSSCCGQTKNLLFWVKDMELIKLPLWINHENIFVQEAVKNRLDGKWKCDLD